MSPDEIKSARKQLACTAKELAAVLDVEQKVVLAWESGELFPTKQYCDRIAELLAKGPSAIPRKAKGGDPMKTLADPSLWELVRKLAAHKKLRDEVTKLAERYPDPAADE